ncbi:MAG: ThiF family adenylyltransferase [Flavobacteriales bacterium]|nr:ThiF family adenylyltransferase [Flavobacteriales bacterium]
MQQGKGSAGMVLIGVGGTGCALLPLISALGPASIRLVDGDTVEAGNLPRQRLFAPDDVGKLKVVAAMERIGPVAPGIHWDPVAHFIDAANITAMLEGSDLVADCTDDLAARALVERTCRSMNIPLVSGAVHGHQVQVITCHGADHSRRREGFFRGRASEDQLGCDMQRVPAAVTTLTASLMALRIADLLVGGDGLAGVMDLVDAEHGRWMRIMGPDAGEFMDTPIRPSHHA